MEAGKLELETLPFDLQSAAEDVLDLLRVKAHEKNLDLALCYEPGAPRQFIGDCGRIRQILVNLVGNSIKFTERGHVQVRAACLDADEAGTRMLLEVEDTGIGIPLSNCRGFSRCSRRATPRRRASMEAPASAWQYRNVSRV